MIPPEQKGWQVLFFAFSQPRELDAYGEPRLTLSIYLLSPCAHSWVSLVDQLAQPPHLSRYPSKVAATRPHPAVSPETSTPQK